MVKIVSRLHKNWLAVVIAAVVTFAGASAALAQGTWKSLTPVPTPTEGMTVGGVGNLIIVAYGDSPALGGDTNLTRIYNISKNSWSSGADAPLPARAEEAYGYTTTDGLMYVIGGRSEAGVINNLERYEVATNSWTTLTPMPTPRAAAAAAVIGSAIFVAGGRDVGGGPCSGNPLDVVERYDIATDTWTTVAPLPMPISDAAAVATGGKLYIIGGCNGDTFTFFNTVLVYNPTTNTWSSLATMPTARASLVSGIVGSNLYAIGGWDGVAPLGLTTNEVYNIASNTWSTAAPMPTSRGEAGVVSHNGNVFVVAGSRPGFGNSTDANEEFTPAPIK